MSTRHTRAGGTITGRAERVLITGANGFVGSNLCRYFLERSYEVVALVRRTSDLHFIEGLPLALVYADLAEPGPIDLPADLDYVIHAAALASETATRAQAMRAIHGATENLLRCLKERGIAPRRFVYISTALVLGHVRGVVLLAGAEQGVAVHEYAPATVKQQITGFGRAEKGQVAFMVTRLLELGQGAEPGDATDALAVALCFACLRTSVGALR